MRITMRIAAAGTTYYSRFPGIASDMAEWKDADGNFDAAKFREELRGFDDFVQFSSNDSRRVITLSFEFLRQICGTFSKAAQDPDADARMSIEKPVDRSLVRKMEREQFGFVRFDIDEVGGALRVRVGVANPKDVVGNVVKNAREFAVDCARVLLYLREQLKGHADVVLAGREGCEDIFNEAVWRDKRAIARDEVDTANAKRMTCPRRLGAYCSPSDPRCRCYRDGECVAVELGDEWKSFKGSKK